MKKITALFLALLMIVGCFSVSVFAAGAAVTFDLTCDGKNDVIAEQNDIIEVKFAILRTDADEAYAINALQNYIIYDEDFFEFVEGSAVCNQPSGFARLVKAISRNKVYMTDMTDQLPATCDFGSFQMKVIGKAGSGMIRNAEVRAYLSGSIPVEITCSDLKVTIGTPVPAEYTVTYDAGEGNVTPASDTVMEGGSVTLPQATRPYYDFTGWSDGVTVYEAGSEYFPVSDITLAAQWTEKPLRNAPSVGSRAESGEGYEDGKLLGTTAEMEYSTDGTNWKPCGSGETAGLSAGIYQVRYAETETEKAGIIGFVTVDLAEEEPEYNIPMTGDTTGIYVGADIVGDDAVLDIDLANLDGVIGKRIITGTVVIDLTVLGDEVIGVVIPRDALEAISAAASSATNDTDGLTIRMKVGSITFDAAALAAIYGQSSNDVRIVIEPVNDNSLNDAQKAALKDRDLLGIFDVYMTDNGKRISDLGNGQATIVICHTIPEDTSIENIMVLYVAPDGALSRLPYTVESRDVLFVVQHFSIYTITADTNSETVCLRDETCPITPFTDTDKNLWWHDGIHFCVENALMIGLDDGTFAPNMTINRAMAVTILWRMMGRPAVNANEKPYDDVDTGCWYTEPICWGTVAGVVEGYGDGIFGPVDDLTREQFALILYRFAAITGMATDSSAVLPFTDADKVNTWAIDAVRWCYARGIVMGRDTGCFDPQGTATRAEAAAMIQRFCRLGA